VSDTSTATSTESPTRSGCLAGGSSSTIFTGTRWTTFTQLPEAFSGGRSAKTAPVPDAMLSTRPRKTASG
jgi:hypothetical protein